MTPKEEEQERQHKFEQKIRIIGGIVSVLGVAATTIMSIMQVEKAARSRMKKVKGRTVGTKLLKGQSAKKKRAKPLGDAKIDRLSLTKLKKSADEALGAAKALQAEVEKEKGDKNGGTTEAATEK